MYHEKGDKTRRRVGTGVFTVSSLSAISQVIIITLESNLWPCGSELFLAFLLDQFVLFIIFVATIGCSCNEVK